MTEIEKMRRYIGNTKSSKDERYFLSYQEVAELGRLVCDHDGLLEVIGLVFDYGKAKGYRCAMAEVRK